MNMSFIKVVLKKSIPSSWKSTLIARIEKQKNTVFLKQLQSNIIKYYDAKQVISVDEREVIEYLKKNAITVFPYDFQEKYDKESIPVFLDSINKLRYVMHDNKKLYFKRSYSENKIKSLYHGLLLDQDKQSPHLYLTERFALDAKDVIADIGAAEGNFSLANVEKVKKIYLFECDDEWIEALEATFNPWKDKVEICNKFVSNTDSVNCITLDNFTKTHPDISFLKVDIEGEEGNFLEGSQSFLHSKSPLKIAICTYHKEEDQEVFTAILKENHFEVETSTGFMIFIHDTKIKAPFLRRGLLRAQKKTASYD